MTDADTVLHKLLDKIIDEPHKDGERILRLLTNGSANYTSSIYSATITAKNEEDLKLFAKVAKVTGKLRELMNLKLMFDTELFVYQDLAKTYNKLEEEHNVKPEVRFKFPKFYGGGNIEGEETIVLEDLVSKGCSSYSRFKSIDWEHAAAAVEALARFHALSFAFEKHDPVNFKKAIDKLTLQIPEQHAPGMREVWLKLVSGPIEVSRDEHKEAISKLLLEELSPRDGYKYKLPLSRPVLCHGDYKICNLLFQRQNGKLKTIVVDYQTVHTGCAPMDLLYLEFMGSDEEFRRENHQRMIDHYYSELTLALERLGVDINEVYPRKIFDSELEEMLPVALRTASFILPLVLVEADHAPQLGKCDDVEKMVVSPNQLFAERYSGLVSDCVRWGVI